MGILLFIIGLFLPHADQGVMWNHDSGRVELVTIVPCKNTKCAIGVGGGLWAFNPDTKAWEETVQMHGQHD